MSCTDKITKQAATSLNALAPGRIDFGVSTGFTARRTMGIGPVTVADLAEYIRIVQGLLAGDTLEWLYEGQRRKIRLMNPDVGAINLTDPISQRFSWREGALVGKPLSGARR